MTTPKMTTRVPPATPDPDPEPTRPTDPTDPFGPVPAEEPSAPAPAPDQEAQQAQRFAAYLASMILPPAEAAPEIGASKWSRQAALAMLESCATLPVYIPLEPWEQDRPGLYVHTVIWNGWQWPVRKGRQELVPEPIARIIYEMLEPARTEQAVTGRPWDCLITGGGTTVRGESFGGKRL